jgi:ectoine hydroxylase-related dioxygenase (phytanoyl-CoA dioxygenase family)
MSAAPIASARVSQTEVTALTSALAENGYCILRGALAPSLVTEIDRELEPDFRETPFCEGSFYGAMTKRFGRLLMRSQGVAALVSHPLILAAVEKLLLPWCDCIQLNVAQAIAIHPGAPAQMPHRDQEMWRVPAGEAEYLVNVIWPLTPFTAQNGATLVWPGSHGVHAHAKEPLDDKLAAEMQPGDALLFLGSTLHGAGPNYSQQVRRGIVIGYSLGWLKPHENPWLAYPPDIARTFPRDLAALIGYRQHRPNLGNFEGQCRSILLDGKGDQRLGAMDALLPQQTAMVDAYRASQAG